MKVPVLILVDAKEPSASHFSLTVLNFSQQEPQETLHGPLGIHKNGPLAHVLGESFEDDLYDPLH